MIAKTPTGNVTLEHRDVTLGALMQASGYPLRGSNQTTASDREVAGLPAWTQAIRIASEAIAKHRMLVWRGKEVDRREVTATWQARFFAGQPNESYSWFYAWECTEASLTARGNAYWVKAYDERGQVASVHVLHPDAVKVRWNRDFARAEYQIILESGSASPWLTSADILHFRIGFTSPNSLEAPSPIALHRQALGSAVAKNGAEERLYNSGSMKSVAVVFPGSVTPTQAEEWKRVFLGPGGSLESSSQVKVFGGDPRIETIGLSLDDQQFIESQAFSIEDIGRILGVPPSLLWAKSSSGSDTLTPEHEEDRWTRYGLEARRQRIEQTIASDPAFFGPAARDYPMFKIGPVRGDVQTESEMLVREVQSGIMLVDEARAVRGLPPLPDGIGLIPQITPVGGAPNEIEAEPAEPAELEEERRPVQIDLRVPAQHIDLRLPAPVEERQPVVVNVPELAPPVVNVYPEVRAPDVSVTNVVEPADVSVEAPTVTVEAPHVEVTVPKGPAPVVKVENVIESPERKITIERHPSGQIKGATIEDSD